MGTHEVSFEMMTFLTFLARHGVGGGASPRRAYWDNGHLARLNERVQPLAHIRAGRKGGSEGVMRMRGGYLQNMAKSRRK